MAKKNEHGITNRFTTLWIFLTRDDIQIQYRDHREYR